jgi:hypothetical protein
MPSELEVSRLLSRLTQATVLEECNWRNAETPDSLVRGTSDIYPYYFETTLKSKKIGLAERRYQRYDGEHDQMYWTNEFVLVFKDIYDRVSWEYRSDHSALYTLFESVREQIADVDGVIKELLDDDEL